MQSLPVENVSDFVKHLTLDGFINFCGTSSNVRANVCHELSVLNYFTHKYLTLSQPDTSLVLAHLSYFNNVLLELGKYINSFNTDNNEYDKDTQIFLYLSTHLPRFIKLITQYNYEVAFNIFDDIMIGRVEGYANDLKLNRLYIRYKPISEDFLFRVILPSVTFNEANRYTIIDYQAYVYYYIGKNNSVRLYNEIDSYWPQPILITPLLSESEEGFDVPVDLTLACGALNRIALNVHMINNILTRIFTNYNNNPDQFSVMLDLVHYFIAFHNHSFSSLSVNNFNIIYNHQEFHHSYYYPQYAKSLNYYLEYLILFGTIDQQLSTDILLYHIMFVRYNVHAAGYDILLELLKRARGSLNILAKNGILWLRKPSDYDPEIHNLGNPNISRVISKLIDEKVAPSQLVLTNF